MRLNAEQIAAIEHTIRVPLMNSLSGFKSANLVGTCDSERLTNLAIVSSVVHLGANPPLLGMVMRPHSVPRGTLENIQTTGFYTLNHVHAGIYEKAHQTSARYPQEISEFNEVGLTEEWLSEFAAPFVAESVIKLGMKLREQHDLSINGTLFIIGEIVMIEMPDELLADDGYVFLEKAQTVAVSSLDTYHQTQLLSHLSYAKPDKSLTHITRDSGGGSEHVTDGANDGTQQPLRSILESRRSHSVKPPACVLVVGASGGIGQAYCQCLLNKYPNITLIRMARQSTGLLPLDGDVVDIHVDIREDESIDKAVQSLPEDIQIDWVFIATGWLHDKDTMPEKTYRHLQREHLLRSYHINAIGPVVFLKVLLAALNTKHPLKIGILSARVGSISDNRLGGWHAYRSSKASLNMLIKNFAIEFKNTRKPITIVGLQPGTTDTPLSAPFQRGLREDQLQRPEYTADQLIQVMNVLEEQDSGGLFDFEGLPFTP